MCPEACFYCYARAMYQRFKLGPSPRLELNGGTPGLYSSPSRVFVCSTFEIFSPAADEFRDEIFSYIVGSPHTFIILTKRPERIDRPMPDNVHLGVSLTGDQNVGYMKWNLLAKAQAKVKFVSFEPLMENPGIRDLFGSEYPAWIVVGRMTGHGKIHDPGLTTLTDIVEFASENKIPIFLKKNLSGIWPYPLIQEYPK